MEPRLFYGLEKMPFTKSSVPTQLFVSSDVKQIRDRLEYLKANRGIGLITGEPGTGKTSVVREFVQSLNRSLYQVIYLHLSTVTTTEFLRMLAVELGLEPRHRKSDLFKQIQAEIKYLVNDKRIIPFIILDEAQYLPADVLKDLVMLLNFDMDSKDYCILVLTGLGSLAGNLKKKVHESLKQRIIVNYSVEGLTSEEAKAYIDYELKSCGCSEPIFTEAAVEAAYRGSQRSLRKLNNILEKSLIEGANQKARTIDENIILVAHNEVEI